MRRGGAYLSHKKQGSIMVGKRPNLGPVQIWLR